MRAVQREVYYFDNEENFSKGLKWYKQQMILTTVHQLTMEKSARYFISEQAPQRVHQMNSSIKIILLLRNPTDRLLSDYGHERRHKGRPESRYSFRDMVFDPETGHIDEDYPPVQVGIYHKHIIRWFQYFSKHQLLILDGDLLITNPYKVIKRAETFLGLTNFFSPKHFIFSRQKGFYCLQMNMKKHCMGNSKGHTQIKVSGTVRKYINHFYAPHNQALFEMIGRRTFSWPTLNENPRQGPIDLRQRGRQPNMLYPKRLGGLKGRLMNHRQALNRQKLSEILVYGKNIGAQLNVKVP